LALALDDARSDPALLRTLAEAAKTELDTVWRTGNRLTPSGLSRYYDDGSGKVMEVSADRYRTFPDTPEFTRHQRSIRESGHDDTHQYGLEAQNYESLELNSLLYRYESELSRMWRRLDGERSTKAARLEQEAASRQSLMLERFWDPERRFLFDYN